MHLSCTAEETKVEVKIHLGMSPVNPPGTAERYALHMLGLKDLYWFPIAIATLYYLVVLGYQKSEMGLSGLKSRCWKG